MKANSQLLLFLLFVVILCLAYIGPARPDDLVLGEAPGLGHLAGTTPFGEDVMRLCARSTGIMVYFAVFASVMATFLGMAVALITTKFDFQIFSAGVRMVGNLLDTVGPLIPLAVFLTLVPSAGAHAQSFVVGFVTWPLVAVPVAIEIQRQRNLSYVQSALLAGGSDWWIFSRHILPEISLRLIPVLLGLILNMAGVFAALQFIGLSKGEDRPLGYLIYESMGYFRSCPWYFIACSIWMVGTFSLIAWLGQQAQALSQLPGAISGNKAP